MKSNQCSPKQNILVAKQYCHLALPYARKAVREYYNKYGYSQIGVNEFFWEMSGMLTPIYKKEISNSIKKEFLRVLVKKIKKIPHAKILRFSVRHLEERCKLYPQLSSVKEHKSMSLIKSITVDTYHCYSSLSEMIASTPLDIQKLLLKKCRSQEELEFYFILCVSEDLDKKEILCYMHENAFKNYQKIANQKKNRLQKQHEMADVFRINLRYKNNKQQEKCVKKFILLNEKQKDNVKRLFAIYKIRLNKNDFDFIQANLWDTYCSYYYRSEPDVNKEKSEKKLEEWRKNRIWEKIMDYFESENVKVKSSKIDKDGLGVFAVRDMPSNVNILYYKGRRIPKDLFDKLAESNTKMYRYAFSYDNNLTIDGDVPENAAKYFNHSCTPNCFATTRNDEIWIISNRRILKGEELTFNYGYTNDGRRIICRCGSKNCSGYIVSYRERIKNYNLEDIV